MDIRLAVILYFITVCILFFYMRYKLVRSFSSLLIAVVISQVILNILYPPTTENLNTKINSWTSLYFFVQIGGFIVLIAYTIIMAITDQEDSSDTRRRKLFAPRIKLE